MLHRDSAVSSPEDGAVGFKFVRPFSVVLAADLAEH